MWAHAFHVVNEQLLMSLCIFQRNDLHFAYCTEHNYMRSVMLSLGIMFVPFGCSVLTDNYFFLVFDFVIIWLHHFIALKTYGSRVVDWNYEIQTAMNMRVTDHSTRGSSFITNDSRAAQCTVHTLTQTVLHKRLVKAWPPLFNSNSDKQHSVGVGSLYYSACCSSLWPHTLTVA